MKAICKGAKGWASLDQVYTGSSPKAFSENVKVSRPINRLPTDKQDIYTVVSSNGDTPSAKQFCPY